MFNDQGQNTEDGRRETPGHSTGSEDGKERSGDDRSNKSDRFDRSDRDDRTNKTDSSTRLPSATTSRCDSRAALGAFGGGGAKLSRGKIIGAVIIVAVIWFLGVQILAAERYSAVVQVIAGENQVGVNPATEKLDFGDLSRGTGASRFVTIKNEGKSEKFIWVIKFGEIANLMSVSENKLTLRPGEEVKLEFAVKIPVSAPAKTYKGRVLIFKWPKL